MQDQSIWEPDPSGVLWRYEGSGVMRRSIRNDALWAAISEVRERNLLKAAAWRDAAVADGWAIRPTYEGHEEVSRAWSLDRDGFKVQGLTRPASGGGMPTMPVAAIHIWGPDGLAIRPPPEYDWKVIVAGVRTCSACGGEELDTKRVGFAGRVCEVCLPGQRKLIETPGWTN